MKYEKKESIKPDYQSIINIIPVKAIEEASKMMQLLVTWKINRSECSKVDIMLVEYDDKLALSEDKLAQLCEKVNGIPSNYYIITWLMCDNTVLAGTYEVMSEEGLELKITISEGTENEYTMRPMWIDSTRQVLLEVVIYNMLIYIDSLIIQSSVDITIDNQCTDIKLTSPVHFIKDAMHHIIFPQQVNSRSIMKANFITNVARDMLGGALLYHMQGKEDTSISAQLLVIWGYNSYGLYSHAWLIEHDITLVWSKDKLERLHAAYNNEYHAYFGTGKWLLDDNTRLKTVCKTLHRGFEMKIVISENKSSLHPRKPLWVDPNW
jgi:hypothetical protein